MNTQFIHKKEALNKPPFFISYFITDPIEYGDTKEILINNLINSFTKHNIDMVCFRDKSTKYIENLAQITLDISKRFNIKKIMINSDINLAIKLGFNGVHLTSNQFNEIKKAKKHNLYVIISCHTIEDIIMAKKYGADGITYSPIFYKKNKGKQKGCKNLSQVVTKYQDKSFIIIALGGIINKEQIKQVKNTNANGFASIRYFKSI